MKNKLLLILLFVGSFEAIGQNRIGLELGSGQPQFSQPGNIAFSKDFVLTGNAYYMRKIIKHFYWGLRGGFEQYSFSYGNTTTDGHGGTYGTRVIHKSAYLNIGPIFDMGIGRFYEYLHMYTYANLGINIQGDQLTHSYYETYNLVGSYDHSTQTDDKINGAIFRIGMGLREQFPLTKKWHLTINECFSFMPFGDLTTPQVVGGGSIHPGYLSLQFGVMHKFKDAHRLVRDR